MSELTSEMIEARAKRKSGRTELYRHFDAAGALLYVGISLSTASRLGQHRCGSDWSKKVVKITIERYPTRKSALAAELAAIQTEHPLHNVTGKLRGYRVTVPSVYLPTSEPDEKAESRLERYFRERGYTAQKGVRQ